MMSKYQTIDLVSLMIFKEKESYFFYIIMEHVLKIMHIQLKHLQIKATSSVESIKEVLGIVVVIEDSLRILIILWKKFRISIKFIMKNMVKMKMDRMCLLSFLALQWVDYNPHLLQHKILVKYSMKECAFSFLISNWKNQNRLIKLSLCYIWCHKWTQIKQFRSVEIK